MSEAPRSALARRAAKLKAAAEARHGARAKELVMLVLEKKREIAGAFWDIGAVVAELADPRLYGALGHSNLAQLTTKELGISYDTAHKLISVSKALPRSQALLLGQERSVAILALAAARDEDPVALATRKISLPGRHAPVLATELSANELKQAVRDVRTARARHKGEHAQTLSEAAAMVEALEAIDGVHASAALSRGVVRLSVSFPYGAAGLVKKTIGAHTKGK